MQASKQSVGGAFAEFLAAETVRNMLCHRCICGFARISCQINQDAMQDVGIANLSFFHKNYGIFYIRYILKMLKCLSKL